MTAKKSDPRSPVPYWRRAAPQTILGVLFLGFLGSLLYDTLVKPGISGSANFLFELIASVSSSIDDAVYQSVALDPRPVGPLILLLSLFAFATAPAVMGLVPGKGVLIKMLLNRGEKKGPEGAEESKVEPREVSWRTRVIRAGALIVIVAVTYTALTMHNKSVLIWRVTTNNLARIRPAVTEAQYLSLVAEFSSVSSASEYTLFQDSLRNVAKRNQVTLHPATADVN